MNEIQRLNNRICCKSTKFYDTFAGFPTTGKVDTLYVDKETANFYIWDGVSYVILSPDQNDHGLLTGLSDDDHAQYLLLAGRAGSQTLNGGTAANEDLTIKGTSNATKTTSYVNIQPTGGNVGIGTTSPTDLLTLYNATSPTIKMSTPNYTYQVGPLADDGVFHIKRNDGVSANRLTILNGGNVGIGTPTPTTKLDILGTSLTGSSTTGTILANQTWNTTGTVDLIEGNVTNTASNATSNLINLKVGGSSVFRVSPTGAARSALGLTLSTTDGAVHGIFPLGNSVIVRSGLFPTDFGTDIFITNGQGDAANTTSTRTLLSITRGFNPTSGNGVYNLFAIVSTINQTGGANGITRGIYINPTITSAADFRAVEITNNTGYGVYQSGASASNLFAGKLVATGIPSYASTAAAAADGSLLASSIFKVTNGDGTSQLHIKS